MHHKVLALDLGVGSIGWALVCLPHKEKTEESSLLANLENLLQSQIIGMGTRVIPLDSESEKNPFEQGKAIQTNQKRTQKRQARRQLYRYKMRRESLINALKEKNMFDEQLLHSNVLPKVELWELRANAAKEQISLTQLGRVLLHLNQKRGYNQQIKGQSEEDESDKKSDEESTESKKIKETYKDKIEKNSKELNGKTIGEYFYEKLRQDSDFRTKDIIFYRIDYQNEFNQIIQTQKAFYPDVLTDEFVQRLFNIIYFQRPLKSQKVLVKICPFASKYVDENGKTIKIGPRVAPKSSPLAQYKRILEQVNSLEITEYEKRGKREKILSEAPLTPSQRQILIDALQNCEKMTQKQILELLQLSTQQYKLNYDKIEGNTTRTKLIEVLGKDHPALQFNLKIVKINTENVDKKNTGGEVIERLEVSSDVEKEPFYQLWHVIYSIKDIEECKKALIKRFHFDEGTAQKLAEIEFTKGSKDFTNMSAKVMRQIIPYLEQGYKYSEAMEKAGYKHSEESQTKEENQQRILKEKLDLLPKNSLRQPVVEKILNQMIHIVNEIIDPQRGWITPEERQNGTFRIHIEFARELKNTPKNRKKLYELNRKRAKENKDIAQKVDEMKIAPSRTNIIRYRLFYGNNKEKTNGICLYSGKTFELREVFDDKIVDKDHIIPQSIYPDDSQGNLVLVYKSENKNKGNRTAYDYMFSKGEQEFEEYLQRIQEAFNNGVITPIQVQNLLTTLEHDPKVPPHSLVQIENKKGERYKIKVRNLDEKGFSARDMRETSYITREAKRILSEICREVVVSTGSITALLRRLWGYDEILPKWHVERLPQIGLSECIEKKVIRDENNQETYIETVKDWSKRDDHRHHAIDALVVACTTRSLIQRINTAHAQGQLKEMEAELSPEEVETAKISNRMTVLKKWLRQQRIFSPQVVKEHVDNILISYKPGKKVATWSKNKNIKGEFDKELPRTLTPRGALHDESYYGKITLYKPLKKDIKNLRNDLDKMHLIAAEDKKSIFGDEKVQYYINKNDIVGLTKYLKETKKITHYTIFEPIQLYVKRYPIGEINKKDVEKKDNFLDEKLYQKLLQVFPQGAKSSDKIKSDISLCKNPLKKIIRGIRMRVSDAEDTDRYYPIHYDKKGYPITFVIPGNNHHVAIYKDSKGNLHEHVCTFWHAVERKKYGIPVIIQNPKEVHDDLKQANKKVSNFLLNGLPNPEWKYVMSMQQNEMFILNMSKNKVEAIIRDKNYQLLSPHLYRVQKLTQGDYTFRNHLATRVDDKNSKFVKSFGCRATSANSLQKLNPIKVHINRLGEITDILEYIPESQSSLA